MIWLLTGRQAQYKRLVGEDVDGAQYGSCVHVYKCVCVRRLWEASLSLFPAADGASFFKRVLRMGCD